MFEVQTFYINELLKVVIVVKYKNFILKAF